MFLIFMLIQNLVFGPRIQVNNFDPDSTLQNHPAVVIDDSENVYVAFQDGVDQYSGGDEIYFSKLCGDTFSTDINLSQSPSINDKYPWIAMSDSNIYVVWQGTSNGQDYKVYYTHSTDSGNTFSPPDTLPGVTINNSTTSGVNDGPQPKIAINGQKIYVVWVDDGTGTLRIKLARSDDGGNAFQDLGTVDNNPVNVNRDPFIDVLEDSLVYVVWRWGTGGTNQDPHPWIAFSKSTDSGNSFSNGVIVLDDSSQVYRGNPAVSVNPATKEIMVVWEDSRISGGNATPDIWFSHSTDGGTTFSPNIKVDNWVTPTTCDNYRANFSTDINGNMAVAWNADPFKSDSFSIYMCSYSDGAFGTPQELVNTYTSNTAGTFGNALYPPSIKETVIDSISYFFMVWQDLSEDPNGNIYYIKGKNVVVLGDLDVYKDTLDLTNGIMEFDSLPAGPAYVSKYFLIVNSDSLNNPDTTDGPAKDRLVHIYYNPITVYSPTDSFTGFLETYPESLGIGEKSLCKLTLYIPEGKHQGDYQGTVIMNGLDKDSSITTDSFIVRVKGPYAEPSLDSLKVFPNPYKPAISAPKIYFEGITGDAIVNVYDVKGRSVFSEKETNSDGLITWDISNIASGVYIYVVKNSSGEIRKGKIAIMK